jgi:hypothetical protein
VFDPAVTRHSGVLRAVVAIGYYAHRYDPARREALVQRESRSLLLRLAVALFAMMQVTMFIALLLARYVELLARRRAGQSAAALMPRCRTRG